MIRAKTIKKCGKGRWIIEFHQVDDLNLIIDKIGKIASVPEEIMFVDNLLYVYSYEVYKKLFEKEIVSKPHENSKY